MWRRRYYVLRANGALEYYSREEDFLKHNDIDGRLQMAGGAVLAVEYPKVPQSKANQLCVEINTPARTLLVHADTSDQMREWITHLHEATLAVPQGTVRVPANPEKFAPAKEVIDGLRRQSTVSKHDAAVAFVQQSR